VLPVSPVSPIALRYDGYVTETEGDARRLLNALVTSVNAQMRDGLSFDEAAAVEQWSIRETAHDRLNLEIHRMSKAVDWLEGRGAVYVFRVLAGIEATSFQLMNAGVMLKEQLDDADASEPEDSPTLAARAIAYVRRHASEFLVGVAAAVVAGLILARLAG
jgi:hypothetical protein